jgi:hypothetical protein
MVSYSFTKIQIDRTHTKHHYLLLKNVFIEPSDTTFWDGCLCTCWGLEVKRKGEGEGTKEEDEEDEDA